MAQPGSRPLAGRTIVVTRATAVGGTLTAKLRALGADVVEAPTTVIEPMDPGPIDEAVGHLQDYDWVVLTSQVGVRLFWEALQRAGAGRHSLHGKKVAVIGSATASALREHGIEPDVVPKRFVAESLLATMTKEFELKDAKILYATAEDARDIVPIGLRQSGALVDVVWMYRSIPNLAAAQPLTAAIDSGSVDLVAFASGSAVEAFVGLVGADRAKRCRAASIGPITTAAARAHSIEVVVESGEATIEALVEALAGTSRPSTSPR